MRSRTGHGKYHAPRKISIELENCNNVVISKKSYKINPYRETGAFVTHFLWRAEELLLKHEDDDLVPIVSVENQSPHSWSSHLYGS